MTKEIKELQYRISVICQELNLNALTFAKMIEFDDIKLVEDVLNKKAMPTLSMLNKITSHLGINPIWLFNMDYSVGYTKFGSYSANIFEKQPFTTIYPKCDDTDLLSYCKDCCIKHIMLVFEDLKETFNPKVAIVLQKEFVYEVISVFDFFDTDDWRTKEGLYDIDSIIDKTKLRSNINVLITAISVANFKEMLSNNHHIGNFIIKNQIQDNKVNKIIDLAFEKDENKARELEKKFDFKSEFLGKIDFVRNFVKSTKTEETEK